MSGRPLGVQMPYETIRVAESEKLLRVTLTRPEQQNSINSTLLRELHAALDQAERSPSCRVVVLEGSGGAFCTGLDFEAATQSGAAGLEQIRQGGEEFLALMKRLTTIPRVIISLVDGRASAGGVGLVAASDFVFATERSQFSLPEALWGLLPCCVLPFLIRRVGFQKAYTMTLSTQPVMAPQALGFHLVDEMSNEPELLIRKVVFRLGKLEQDTLSSLKRYFGDMWVLSQETERIALEEYTRLMSSAVVQRNIENFVTTRRFPWEA